MNRIASLWNHLIEQAIKKRIKSTILKQDREEIRTVETETSNTMTIRHSLMLHPARTSIFSCYKRMLFLARICLFFPPSITSREKRVSNAVYCLSLHCIATRCYWKYWIQELYLEWMVGWMNEWMNERMNEQFHLVPVGQTNDSFGWYKNHTTNTYACTEHNTHTHKG